MLIQPKIQTILKEISSVLVKINEKQVQLLINEILKANTIITLGAGRVGLATRAFTMRLGHLGLRSFFLGDTTLPAIGKSDLLIVSSGSGETQTIFDLVRISSKHKLHIALITSNPKSRIGQLALTIVEIQAPSKIKPINNIKSIQPMTTLNEQCLNIFFDSLILLLMKKLNETHNTMWARHSSLE